MNINRQIGENLREVRKAKSLSLLEVETNSHRKIKASILGAYERGERAISIPRLFEVAAFYEVSPGSILEGRLLGTADDQLDQLANFIMFEVPGEPSQDQGAVDTAIRLIRNGLDQQANVLKAQRLLLGAGHGGGLEAAITALIADRDQHAAAWERDAGAPVPLTDPEPKVVYVCSQCRSANIGVNVIDGVEYDWCENCGTETTTVVA